MSRLTLVGNYLKKKMPVYLFIVVAMTGMMSNVYGQSSYSWQGTLIRNLNPENFWVYPSADLDSDGNTYIMYRYRNMDDIRIERWNGTTWTQVTSVLKTSIPNCLNLFDYQDMAVDGNNNIHIVTKGSSTNDTHGLFYGFYNGSSWSFEYIDSYPALFNSKYYLTRPIIEVDANNNPYIGYAVRDSNPSPSHRTMKCAMKISGTWTISNIETIVEANGDEFDMYDFTVSASGVPHAVYTDENNNDYVFEIRHEYYNGSSWVPTTLASGKTSSGFLIRTDASNHPYVVMSEGTSDFSSYWFSLYKNTTGTWTTEQIFSPGVLDYWPADLSFNGNDDLNIVYSTLDWNTWESSAMIALQKESGVWKPFTSTTPTDWSLFSEGAYTFDDNKGIVIVYTNDLSERPRTISYLTGTYSPGVPPPAVPSVPDLAAGSDSGTSASDNITNDDTPTFVGTADPSKTIKLFANGTLVGTSTSDGSGNWSVTASTLTNGTYNITAKASDSNGESAASTALSVTIDKQSPTVTLATIAANPTNASPFTVTITFSEAVTGFDNGDVSVGNGAKSGFSGSGSSYSVNITPTSDGLVTINVAGAVATDVAGNANSAATQLSRTSDRTSPTVSLSTTVTDPTNASVIPVTITFSEAVTGFVIGNLSVTNGSASNFAGNGTTYTADITPIADGTVSIDIAAGVATDGAGNNNTAATQLTRTSDRSAPSVSMSSTASNPTNQNIITVNIAFNESVTGFDVNDIVVTGGNRSNFQGSLSTYTIDITPTGEGTITANIAAGVATDASGNGNTAATQFSIVSDKTKPTVTVSSGVSGSTNASPFAVTVTFSESVTGFDISDLSVGNGSASNFSGSGSSYTADITPAADGQVTVSVASATATDGAGNDNESSNLFSVMSDRTKPSVITSTSAGSTVNTAFDVIITFSEAVSGFDLTDLSVSNGTASNLTGSGASYGVTITPTSDGIVTIDVPGSIANDAAGNTNTAATQLSRTADVTAPSVSLATTATEPTNASVIPVTITFSEAVTGFAVGDLSVTNASVSNFAGSGTTYTADITPAADGQVSINVAAGVAQDGAGNSNTAATQLTRTSDRFAPTVSMSSAASNPSNLNIITVNITFSENVTGFDVNDIVVTGGTRSNFQGSLSTYTIDITPSGDGTITANIAADAALDVSGNGNTAATEFSIVSDRTKPTADVSTTAASVINTSFDVTITFSEAVTGFTQSDITVANGTVSNVQAVNTTTYTAQITPSADGLVTVSIPADGAMDNAANGNTASSQLQRDYDMTKPSLVISSTSNNQVNTAFTVTFTFSEAVTGFDATDVTIVNGSGSAFAATSSSVYTMMITPASEGDTEISVNTSAATDEAGNSSSASNTLSRHYDITSPTVTIASTASDPVNSSFTVTFNFSEDVTGFISDDISIVNGAGSSFSSQSASTYSMIVTPTADGTVAISVAGELAADAATNGNTASGTLSRVYDATPPAVTVSSEESLVNGAFAITISFTEEVEDIDANDITVSNGTAGDLQTSDNIHYTATITPVTDGDVSVSVTPASTTDEAGNANTISNTLTVSFDGTAPSGYSVSSDIDFVDVNNVTAFAFSVSGAEVGTHYYYTITSSNGGASMSGDGMVSGAAFDLSGLDLSGVFDGTLTVTVYLEDEAGNRGADASFQFVKLTRNIVAVTNPSMVTVPIRTTFAQLNLPATVEVTYSNGEDVMLEVTWQEGSYDGFTAGEYVLTSTFTLPPNATNNDGHTAEITVKVNPNIAPTAITLSSTSFAPDISSIDPVGAFTTSDTDDTEHTYELVSGSGDEHNDYFFISNNEIFLFSTSGLSGVTEFNIRMRSTDPYGNTVEQTFTLTKQVYTPAVAIRVPNSFSPNGDGVNDEWRVPELAFYNEVVIEVYDRAGNRLFHTTNPETGWDGVGLDGKVLLGPYFYIIQIRDTGETKQGVLMLLKR